MSSTDFQVQLYALADTLMLHLLVDKKGRMEANGKLVWRTPWGTQVPLGDSISLARVKDAPHALMRVSGDFWIYASVLDKENGCLVVLDAAKTPATLPAQLVHDWATARKHLREGAVAVFRRKGRGRWNCMEKPAS